MKKKRICVTIDSNTEAKLKQIVDLKLKDSPMPENKRRSQAVRLAVDEYGKSLLVH